MKKASQTTIRKFAAKTISILISLGIGVTILHSAATTPKESPECAKLKNKLNIEKENERNKKKDFYLGTTKSAAPERFKIFRLESDYNKKCAPLKNIKPENNTNKQSTPFSPEQQQTK